jgi:chorismate mutase / prephenate dehydratase
MAESTPNLTGGRPHADISKLRLAIDEIDEKIMDLINRRLRLAQQIGRVKKQGGLQVSDLRREKEIIDRLLQKNRGPLDDDGLEHIFATIITEGRKIQNTD